MPSRRHAPLPALATALLSAVLLSGCLPTNNSSDSIPDTPLPESETDPNLGASADPEASGPSVEGACVRLRAAMDEADPAIQEAVAQIATDPAEAVESLQSVSAGFAQTRDELTDPEVRQVADETAVALEEMIEDLSVAVTDPSSFDLDAFAAETVPEVQARLAAIDEVCAP